MYNTESFIKKAREVHGDKYDYSKVKYVKYNVPVCIIHPIYGEFWQKPTKHLEGAGFNKKIVKYTYEVCYNAAKQYDSFYTFRKYELNIFRKAKEQGWLKDYTWLKYLDFYINPEETDKCVGQSVYAYEFSDKSVYVGLTNNILRRDKQHRTKEYNTSGQLRYDGVLSYSESANIPIPNVKVLETGLTRRESQIEEQRYINQYRKDGWNILNRCKGGSLGSNCTNIVWDKKTIIEEAKKYKTTNEMKKYSRTAFNHMKSLGLDDVCFPNKRKLTFKEPHTYTEEFLLETKEK